MASTRTVSPTAAKAARIALVFLLVFWSSFRVEYALALQGMAPEGLEGHEEGTLAGLVVYQVDADEPDKLGGAVRSVSQTIAGEGASALQVEASEKALMFVASAQWSDATAPTGDDVVTTANFVEWEVDGATAESPGGVLNLDISEAGSHAIACHLKAGDEKYLAESFTDAHATGDFKVEFKVEVNTPEPDETPLPDINPIEILGSDGAPTTGQVNVSKGSTYQFDVRLTVVDSVTNEVLHEYRQSTSEAGLAELTDQQLTDVSWSLSGEAEGVASIDPKTGLLTADDDGDFTVTCSVSPQSDRSHSWNATAQVKVGAGKVEDPQGDDHSQEVQTLTVVADLTALQQQDEDRANQADDAQARQSDAEGDAPAGEEGGADGSASATAEPNGGQGEGQAGADPASEAVDSGDEAKPGQVEPVVIQKTYSLDELSASFAQGTGTYTMPSATGPVTVTGSGVWLADLLKDAGIDVDTVPIESVDFVSYSGEAVTVSWNELTTGNSSLPNVLVASESRVMVESGQGAGTDEGPSGSGADARAEGGERTEDDAGARAEEGGAELLPNTRFRILFDTANSSIDSSALRYISMIRVNPKVPEPSKQPAKNDVFSVSVSYVPVPVGVTAVLVAVPSYTINGRWDCLWEESVDGNTWVPLENSAVQTLYIPTTSDRLGHQFRVTIETNIKDDKSGDLLAATSDPVTLQAGSGFSVVLKYNPPVAGDVAIFQSEVLGYNGAISDVVYTWEWTEDGGASWMPVDDDQKGATLHIPTEAISDEALVDEVSSSEEAESNLIYIRVSASAPDPDNPGARLPAVSNMQPLTVRVGETGTDGGVPGAQPDLPGSGDSSTTPGQAGNEGAATDPKDSAVPSANPPVVTEVESFVMEDTPSGATAPRADVTSDANASSAPEPAASSTDQRDQEPAPNPTVNGTQIYINDQVSAQVSEQKEVVEQYVQATQPGARWTSLNTVAPKGDDVGVVLASNPFAPFVLPFALGITASGVVEKLVAFRRQLL